MKDGSERERKVGKAEDGIRKLLNLTHHDERLPIK